MNKLTRTLKLRSELGGHQFHVLSVVGSNPMSIEISRRHLQVQLHQPRRKKTKSRMELPPFRRGNAILDLPEDE